MTSVAAVIPSWNTLAHIDRCIESLLDEVEVPIELFVVDNGSTDGSLQYLRDRGIDHLSMGGNRGFAAAVNAGAQHTSAPFVLVLNADVVLEKGCVASLARALRADALVAGVQPTITNPPQADGVVSLYSTGQALTVAATAYELRTHTIAGDEPTSSEIFGVCGAVCLLRREMFTQLGGYDERYFAFYEDVDLNARARLAGWSFRHVPDAIAMHVGHASWGGQDSSGRAFNARLTVRNRACTAVKVLPARCLPWVALATIRTVAAAPFRRVGAAVLSGTWGFLRLLPQLLRERQRLRTGQVTQLDSWLVNRPMDKAGRDRAWRQPRVGGTNTAE